MTKLPATYIMASKRNGTLYTGVTSDLVKRVWQHRTGCADGFTKRYDCKLLVWYEVGGDMRHAIVREEQIKAGSRVKKLALIESMNSESARPVGRHRSSVIPHRERSEAIHTPHWIAARLWRSQ